MRPSKDKSFGPIGIDVGARCIKAVQFNRSPDGWRMTAAAAVPRLDPSSKVQPKEVRALGRVLRSAGFQGQQVVLAAPGEKLLTGIMGLPPRASGAPIEQIARLELSRMHKQDPETFEMACWDLPAPARAKEATYVMAAACPHADANALLDVFEREGLVAKGLDIHATALARACGPLLQGLEGIAAVYDLGWCRCGLVLLYRGVVVYEKRRNAGFGSAVAKLAQGQSLDEEQAERLLMSCGLESPADAEAPDGQAAEAARRAAAEFADGIIDELRMPLSYVGSQYPDAPMDRLLLVGGGAEIPGLEGYLGGRVGVEVRKVGLGDLAAGGAAPAQISGPVVAVAAGLALFDEGRQDDSR